MVSIVTLTGFVSLDITYSPVIGTRRGRKIKNGVQRVVNPVRNIRGCPQTTPVIAAFFCIAKGSRNNPQKILVPGPNKTAQGRGLYIFLALVLLTKEPESYKKILAVPPWLTRLSGKKGPTPKHAPSFKSSSKVPFALISCLALNLDMALCLGNFSVTSLFHCYTIFDCWLDYTS